MSPRKPVLVLFVLCVTAVLTIACGGGPKDPAERIDQIRSGYEASLNGFVVEQVPQTGEPDVVSMDMGAEDEAAQGETAGAAEGEAGAGDEMAGEAGTEGSEVSTRQDAVLDILLSLHRRDTLPGITVDIEQVGPEPEHAVKATYHAYLDTSDIQQGGGTQVSYRLENVDYQEGDGFHVEVRYPIPPGERGEYREFQEAGEGQQ